MDLKKNTKKTVRKEPNQIKLGKKRWVNDPDGTLGVAKSIASRFGEEICEDEFFDLKEKS